MNISAGKIAELLGGELEGDENVLVGGVSKIEEGMPNTLSFLANPKYQEYIYSTKASVVIVAKNFVADRSLPDDCTLIRVEDPYGCFAKLLELYHEKIKENLVGVEQPSYIGENAQLGKDVYIGAFAYVGKGVVIEDGVKIYPGAIVGNNSKIGRGSIIYSGVKIYANTIIGKECVVHAGAVLGSDGFGFAPNSQNNYKKVPQTGNVILEDHVEIGANTTIDKATLGSTRIKKGVKLDNLIQIAHNVEIGENTVIAAQTGVAGSTKLGKDMMVGGQVGIIGHLHIADEVKIAAQSGIGHSVEKKGEILQGSPAYYIGDYKKSYVLFKNLPVLKRKIDELEKEIKELKDQLK